MLSLCSGKQRVFQPPNPKLTEPLKLRLGLGSAPAPALPNSVLWLARDLGFYKREGLDVELNEFQGTPLVIAGMIAGDIDVGNVSTSDVIRMNATKGQAMRAIHSPDTRLYFLIAARDTIKSANALQDKTFAVARIGSVDHTLSMIALKGLGRQHSFSNGGRHRDAFDSRPGAGGRPRRCHHAFTGHLGNHSEGSPVSEFLSITILTTIRPPSSRK